MIHIEKIDSLKIFHETFCQLLVEMQLKGNKIILISPRGETTDTKLPRFLKLPRVFLTTPLRLVRNAHPFLSAKFQIPLAAFLPGSF